MFALSLSLPFIDWACGGQWNRAYQFVALLVNAFDMANIEIVAFFDGTLSERVRNESQQKEVRQKTISVLKHIRMIGTPPPKIWWLHPSGIRTCIRNALRCHDIQVVSISMSYLYIDQYQIPIFCVFPPRFKRSTTIAWRLSTITENARSTAFSD